jgi:3-phenylpropionate/trans-cinnamate dioxygenase ferredoxin reductase subunit
MLGRGEPYDRLPYFFSDQYDLGMEYIGLHAPGDRLVLRGSPQELDLHAFWLDAADRLTAGMHINRWDTIEPIERLIESGARIDPARLADPDIPLEELAGGAPARP